MTGQTTLSPDLSRLASGRDWYGYLTLENLEAVAERMRKLLTGHRYTWVACNGGLRDYFPEVRTGQELQHRGVSTFNGTDGGRYAGITVPDTYGAWGLHTDVADQPAARKRRDDAWERASKEDRAGVVWQDKDLTHLHIKQDRIEVEHFAPIGYHLYWVITVEQRDEERDAIRIAGLDDAITLRSERAHAYCLACGETEEGMCAEHTGDLAAAEQYRAERDRLEGGR